MKKLFAFCAMMLAVINLSAQSTARKFVLKNSADGKVNSPVIFLRILQVGQS